MVKSEPSAPTEFQLDVRSLNLQDNDSIASQLQTWRRPVFDTFWGEIPQRASLGQLQIRSSIEATCQT